MYSIEIREGHLLANISGKTVLIDTGSPTSIGRVGNFTLNGRSIQLQSSFQGIIDIDGFSELLGFDIDILLGCDCLNKFDIEINAKKKTITFNDGEQVLLGNIMNTNDIHGIQVVQVKIDDTPIRMYFDTGAKISYIEKRLSNKFTPMEEVEDFYPGLGKFKTMTYKVPIGFEDSKINLTCGVLPEKIEHLMRITLNVDGILGSEVFSKFLVLYAPRRKKICFSE